MGLLGIIHITNMDTESIKQYMKTLQEEYLQANRKKKGAILDEFCKNTKQDRKYAIKKFRNIVKLKKKGEKRKPRTEYYNGLVKAALARMWKIFDYPCGQRLAPLLETETDRMRKLNELVCSDETAGKLKTIVPSTIDEKLKHEKEVEMQKNKYKKKCDSLLCSKVPTKTSAELDRENPGVEQIDFVEHCGASAAGEYVNSLSIVDIFSGWWEGDGVMGKGQGRALKAIDEARKRSPVPWREMHPDNGGNIMNYHVYEYAMENGIDYSRSRPYKKNDNCFVEQKNSTHIRQVVGHLRHDTEEERKIISDLYRNELRLYKNFFQPVLKLIEKIRIKGKNKNKYDQAKTPYLRPTESDIISQEKKEELKKIYNSLNPAELKRMIDAKLKLLYKEYQKSKNSEKSEKNYKKLTPSIVSLLIGQPV